MDALGFRERAIMAQQFFRQVDGQKIGPLSAKAILDLAKRGEIQSDEQLFCEQTMNWLSAGKIQGLVFGPPPGAGPPRQPFSPLPGAPAASEDVFLPDPAVPKEVPRLATRGSHPELPVSPMWSPESEASLTSVGTESTTGNAKPPQWGLIIGAVVACMLILGVLAVGAYVFTREDRSATELERLAKIEDELKAERERLRTEIDKLKSEVQRLEKNRDGLQQDTNSLEQSKEQLESEIEKLTTKRQILDRWKGVDLVLMNSKQQAVGLQKKGEAFVVFDKQEGELAEAVLSASRNLHIPRTSEDSQLAKDVFQLAELAKMFWILYSANRKSHIIMVTKSRF